MYIKKLITVTEFDFGSFQPAGGQLAARRKFFANVVLRSLIAGWDRFVDINPESTVFDIVFFLLNFGDQIGRQF